MENPYTKPLAAVHAQEATDKALRMAELKISQAWIGACIASALAGMTLVHGLTRGGIPVLIMQVIAISVVMLLLLAFGVYRKSRFCALLLLLNQIASSTLILMQGKLTLTALFVLVFTYLFAQGLLGCIRYHQLKPLAETYRLPTTAPE